MGRRRSASVDHRYERKGGFVSYRRIATVAAVLAAGLALVPALAFAGDAGAIDRRLAPLLAREGPIAGYMAHRGEPDILPFLLRSFHLGHRIA